MTLPLSTSTHDHILLSQSQSHIEVGVFKANPSFCDLVSSISPIQHQHTLKEIGGERFTVFPTQIILEMLILSLIIMQTTAQYT